MPAKKKPARTASAKTREVKKNSPRVTAVSKSKPATKKKSVSRSKTAPKNKPAPRSKPGYVDGFVLVVPKANLEAYGKMSKNASQVWMDHGAIDYHEAFGEDLAPVTSLGFNAMTRASDDELVVFAWITYKSRAHRDRVNKKVMADPRLDMDPNAMPFDPARMAFGGFKIFVSG